MADDIQIQKMDGKSLDVTGVNKEKLKTVFPECFTEDKLDIDKLLSLCGEYIDNDFEKYKFEWKGKSECYRIAGKRSTGTLRPCPEEGVDFENTNNLYIEGDNLEVLKLLQTAYYRKVKMIYIDPPYNTGNDFVYEDDFKDPMAKYKEITSQTTKSNPETMGRYHTNWLNMMYPRLRLAANLLRDDGVIFISIDDNEVDNLKKICNEVFGEENFIVNFPRVTKKGGKSSDVTARNHDYILMYAKSIEDADLKGVAHNDEGYSNKDEYFEERGFYKLNQTLDYDSLGYVPTLDYPIEINGEIFYAGGDKNTYEERQRGLHGRADWGWRWSKDLFAYGLKNGFIEVKRGGSRPRIYTKTYQNVKIESVNGHYEIVKIDRTKPLSTLEFTENEYSNDNATKCIAEIIGKGVFEYTKHPALIKKLMTLVNGTDFIVLDFFSGSATTAHAVMQLNAEDGGKRQFIMVQLPELTDEKSEAFKAGYKNICEIGKERIRRAGKKILDDLKREETVLQKGKIAMSFPKDGSSKSAYIENPVLIDFEDTRGRLRNSEEYKETTKNLDTGFKVFKLDTSNLVKWDDTPTDDTNALKERFDTMIKSLKFDRSELDVVYEVMLKLGIPVTYKVAPIDINGRKVYSIGEDGLILVCLDGSNGGITPEDITEMCDLAPAKIVAAEEAFKDDVALSNAYYISKDSGVEIMLL